MVILNIFKDLIVNSHEIPKQIQNDFHENIIYLPELTIMNIIGQMIKINEQIQTIPDVLFGVSILDF